MEVKGGKLFADKADQKMVVLCTTKTGEVEIRTLETFERELSLNSSDNEIVQDVEGTRKRNTRFTLIKKIIKEPDKKPEQKFEGLSPEHKAQVIHAFYKVHGYKTKINKGVAH